MMRSIDAERATDNSSVGAAAVSLTNHARRLVVEDLGAVLTGGQRAAVLQAMLDGAPVAISIRLSPPRALTIWLAGEPLCHVDFDPETLQ